MTSRVTLRTFLAAAIVLSSCVGSEPISDPGVRDGGAGDAAVPGEGDADADPPTDAAFPAEAGKDAAATVDGAAPDDAGDRDAAPAQPLCGPAAAGFPQRCAFVSSTEWPT